MKTRPMPPELKSAFIVAVEKPASVDVAVVAAVGPAPVATPAEIRIKKMLASRVMTYRPAFTEQRRPRKKR